MAKTKNKKAHDPYYAFHEHMYEIFYPLARIFRRYLALILFVALLFTLSFVTLNKQNTKILRSAPLYKVESTFILFPHTVTTSNAYMQTFLISAQAYFNKVLVPEVINSSTVNEHLKNKLISVSSDDSWVFNITSSIEEDQIDAVKELHTEILSKAQKRFSDLKSHVVYPATSKTPYKTKTSIKMHSAIIVTLSMIGLLLGIILAFFIESIRVFLRIHRSK